MESKSSPRGEALQIAYVHQNKLCFASDKLDSIIDKVGDRDVSVISLNGPMRTGKSYILGHFLKYFTANENEDWFTKKLEKEFHWVNSAERQTTGISMWSEPFFVMKNGKEIAVLLMDTQGCFDDKTSMHENSLIFALSCILSSVLIYNVPKQISEDVLQFFQLFIGYATMAIDSKTTEPFSKLIFLVRDWQFPKDYAFGYHDISTTPGSRNYKKEKLDAQPEMPPEIRATHELIMSSFKNVGCCLLPYPGDDLALYDTTDNLGLPFVKAVKDFIPRILDPSNIVLKQIGGYIFNGEGLKKLVEELAALFERSDIPPVQSVAESTAEVQNVIAQTNGMNYYKSRMDKKLNSPDGIADCELENIHKKFMEKAVELFKAKKRLKNERIEKRYFNMLKESIQNAFQYYQQANRIQSNFRQMKNLTEEQRRDLEKEIKELKSKAWYGSDLGISKIIGLGLGPVLGALHVVISGSKRGGDYGRTIHEGLQIMSAFSSQFNTKLQ